MKDSVEMLLNEYLTKHHPARILFNGLQELGDMYLIGGVLREIKDNGRIISLRDMDVVLNTTNEKKYEQFLYSYSPEINRFGGYRVQCQDLIIDIWLLRQTWAYSKQVIKCDSKDYAQMLPRTVFLNIDAIIYDMKNDKWYDTEYQKAMKTRVLDIVLEENPFIELNIVRSIVLKQKYEMAFSDKLREVIKKYINECTDKEIGAASGLYNAQNKRYKKEILSQIEYLEILREVLYN